MAKQNYREYRGYTHHTQRTHSYRIETEFYLHLHNDPALDPVPAVHVDPEHEAGQVAHPQGQDVPTTATQSVTRH